MLSNSHPAPKVLPLGTGQQAVALVGKVLGGRARTPVPHCRPLRTGGTVQTAGVPVAKQTPPPSPPAPVKASSPTASTRSNHTPPVRSPPHQKLSFPSAAPIFTAHTSHVSVGCFISRRASSLHTSFYSRCPTAASSGPSTGCRLSPTSRPSLGRSFHRLPAAAKAASNAFPITGNANHRKIKSPAPLSQLYRHQTAILVKASHFSRQIALYPCRIHTTRSQLSHVAAAPAYSYAKSPPAPSRAKPAGSLPLPVVSCTVRSGAPPPQEKNCRITALPTTPLPTRPPVRRPLLPTPAQPKQTGAAAVSRPVSFVRSSPPTPPLYKVWYFTFKMPKNAPALALRRVFIDINRYRIYCFTPAAPAAAALCAGSPPWSAAGPPGRSPGASSPAAPARAPA